MRGFWLFLYFTTTAFAQSRMPHACDQEWGVIAYYARMTNSTLNHVVRFDLGFSDANLVAYEVEHELACDNVLRETFRPIVGDMSVAFNSTFQDDPVGSIMGLNALLLFTWKGFPWDKSLVTTFSLIEGVSYMTDRPQWETRTAEKAQNDRRFLNFLGGEVTAALPQDPSWQLVYRIHHRSGVFGLYCPGIVGSTAIGMGLRHTFL